MALTGEDPGVPGDADSRYLRVLDALRNLTRPEYWRERTGRAKGAVVAVAGFVLSPLSWWNDLLVNVPIAYVIALPFGALRDDLFLPALIGGYWLTNVAGLVMLHRGLVTVARGNDMEYGRKQLATDLAVALLYTVVMVLLVRSDVLRLPWDY